MTYQTYRKLVFFTLAIGLILAGALLNDDHIDLMDIYSPVFVIGMGLFGLSRTEKDFKKKK